MTDYTAKIRAKGLDATGVTEELAQQMYNTLGKSTLAIVELKHSRQIHDADGDRAVELVLTLVEPSTNPDLDAHLRELTRTMHQNRVLQSRDDQLQIETGEDLEPKVEDVIRAGQHHIAQTDDELPEPGDESDGDTEYDDSHDFEAGPDDSCICGRSYGDPIHGHDVAADWVDSQHGDAPEEPDEEWEYDQAEGTRPAVDPANPFATTST